MPLHTWPNARVAWKSFHQLWIAKITEHLNQILPAGFQARPEELIIGIAPDVLVMEEEPLAPPDPATLTALGEATFTAILTLPADYPFVGVYSQRDANRLVAAIEVISPGNKDRLSAAQNFVNKAILLLQDGVHLMVIDVIRDPAYAMRQALLRELGLKAQQEQTPLWAASYCALPEDDPHPHITVREWAEELRPGGTLPALPLFLQYDQWWVMVDLEATYQATLRAGRYKPA